MTRRINDKDRAVQCFEGRSLEDQLAHNRGERLIDYVRAVRVRKDPTLADRAVTCRAGETIEQAIHRDNWADYAASMSAPVLGGRVKRWIPKDTLQRMRSKQRAAERNAATIASLTDRFTWNEGDFEFHMPTKAASK